MIEKLSYLTVTFGVLAFIVIAIANWRIASLIVVAAIIGFIIYYFGYHRRFLSTGGNHVKDSPK